MKTGSRWMVATVAALALATGGYLWWMQRQTEATPAPTAPTMAAQPAPSAEPTLMPASAPAEPAILHPMEATAPTPHSGDKLPALAESDKLVSDALTGLLGQRDTLSFLNLDGFIRRAVATTDNLGRAHAASQLWPVVPMPGRFTTVESAAGTVLAEANSQRYTPFVKFATSIDAKAAAGLYRRLYPLCQQAYEDLGFPGKYFNDRLVAVIDLLLATPSLQGPVPLTLTQVQGPIPVTRPWVRYEYADPALQERPAGQKILMRMGNANAKQLKTWLKAFRAQIAVNQPGK